MLRSLALLVALAALVPPASAAAQVRLTLADAITRARSGSTDARAAAAAEREAAQRVPQARAGYFPRVDFTESWQRGDQPVFAFGSLLNQRRFSAADFAGDRLNHPEAITNWRTGLVVEQLVFDGGMTRAGVRSAELGRDAAGLMRAQTGRDLAVSVTEAYGGVLQLEALRRSAAAAVDAAAEDLKLARLRREAGLVTDADVLALAVHAAAMQEQRIRTDAEAQVARGRLNHLMGAPLETVFELDPAPPAAPSPDSSGALEAEALGTRPEVKLAVIQERLAAETQTTARAAFLPQLAFQGVYELNGQTVPSQVSSWIVGAQFRLNLFHGLADKARLAEVAETRARRVAERERAESLVRLDVRAALARLDAARAREAVGRASVAQARESHRIIRDRYESGMADVADLLRAAQAVLDAESQEIAARVDVLVQSAALDRALGR